MSSRPLADAITKATTTQYGVTKFAESGEATVGEAVQSNDVRLSNGRPPSGAAGGVLNGDYPNPGFATPMATAAALAVVSGVADDAAADAATALTTAGTANTNASAALTMATVAIDATDAAQTDATAALTQIAAHVIVEADTGVLGHVTTELIQALIDASSPSGDIDAAQIVSGIIDAARLGSGLAADEVLLSDGSWGKVSDAALAVDYATAAELATHAAIVGASGVSGHFTTEQVIALITALFALKAGDSFTGQVNFVPTYTDPVAAARGINTLLSHSDTAANAVASEAGRFDLQIAPASGISNTGINSGIVAFVRNVGLGTLSVARAARLQILNSGGGIITTAYGFYLDNPSIAGVGTVGTIYGAYFESQKTAAVTTAYGVYQAGASDWNFFAGRVGFGNNTPLNNVEISQTTGGILTIRRVDTSVTAGDMIGKIQFYAADTSTVTNFIVAEIEAQATNSVSTDINPGRLIFRTTPTGVAAVPTEAMRIDEAQRVGIGVTATLVEQLEVNGRVKATGFAGVLVSLGWYDELTPSTATLGPTYPIDRNLTLSGVGGWAETLATGSAVQVDVQYKRGAGAWTSIFSTYPQFAVGANAITAGVLSTTQLNQGDYVRRRWIGTPAGIADVTVTLQGTSR